MDLDLAGKNVVVTGGSKGIGRSVAMAFLGEGANVAILARGEEALHQAQQDMQSGGRSPDRLKVITCDCTSVDELGLAARSLEADWTNIDVLVANVGSGLAANTAVPNREDWEKSWTQNFESARASCEVFLPALEKKGGAIVLISSIAGREVIGAPVVYSVAKAAIEAFAKNLAHRLAPAVRVNAVAPGNVIFDGGRWQQLHAEAPEKVEEMLKQKVPMGRFGKPEEIANVVLFVASSRASFMTGASIVVDGGQTVS